MAASAAQVPTPEARRTRVVGRSDGGASGNATGGVANGSGGAGGSDTCVATKWCLDADGNHFGDPKGSVMTCNPPGADWVEDYRIARTATPRFTPVRLAAATDTRRPRARRSTTTATDTKTSAAPSRKRARAQSKVSGTALGAGTSRTRIARRQRAMPIAGARSIKRASKSRCRADPSRERSPPCRVTDSSDDYRRCRNRQLVWTD